MSTYPRQIHEIERAITEQVMGTLASDLDAIPFDLGHVVSPSHVLRLM
jgi:hypothetical protein